MINYKDKTITTSPHFHNVSLREENHDEFGDSSDCDDLTTGHEHDCSEQSADHAPRRSSDSLAIAVKNNGSPPPNSNVVDLPSGAAVNPNAMALGLSVATDLFLQHSAAATSDPANNRKTWDVESQLQQQFQQDQNYQQLLHQQNAPSQSTALLTPNSNIVIAEQQQLVAAAAASSCWNNNFAGNFLVY